MTQQFTLIREACFLQSVLFAAMPCRPPLHDADFGRFRVLGGPTHSERGEKPRPGSRRNV